MNCIKYLSAIALLVVIILPACKKEKASAEPTITSIRNYAAAPNDTVVTSITPGQWVVIHGQNLKNALHIRFDGVEASFNYGDFANDMAVVQIPSVIPFNGVPADLLNTVTYVTTTGTTTYQFNFNYPAPVITGLSNETFFPGDSLYIAGSSFFLVQSVQFAGATITKYNVDSMGTRIGFVCPPKDQVPGGIITVVAKGGTASTTKTYAVGKPSILLISNENPNAGDSVYIVGAAFKDIQSLVFAGATISTYNVSPDYTTIGFVCPTLSASGIVTITTLYGTASTIFNVNDINTGIVGNFEWGNSFGWQWWGGASLESGDPNSGWPPYDPLLAGNRSMYMLLNGTPMNSGDGNNSSTAIRLNAAQWVPASNIGDAPENWALKFELNVAKPWSGGSLCITTDINGYMFRWEPWSSPSGPVDFQTNRWLTVTIPLSAFRANSATAGDGKGAVLTDLTKLIGTSGNTGMYLYMHNYGNGPTEKGYYAGFDNMRVVKIK
ncbi:MAG: glycan-binding surface protein [Niastella sp.]|uniref:glycan-binding surface protein n=1 Tax=Niastella sp. TaxID=1869183 RepID=UPI00389A6771